MNFADPVRLGSCWCFHPLFFQTFLPGRLNFTLRLPHGWIFLAYAPPVLPHLRIGLPLYLS